MRHLTVMNFGDCLGVSGGRLTVRSHDGELFETSLNRLRSIRIAKNGISVSSNLIQACAARGIRLYFVDWQGKGVAAVCGQHQHAVASIRKAQFETINSCFAQHIARALLLAKMRNQRAVLLYFGKYQSHTHPQVAAILQQAAASMNEQADALKTRIIADKHDWRQVLMGYEGQCAALYWRALKSSGLLPQSFQNREGRGALEITNAALNYGYSILETYCWSALDNAGLELYAGFLHVDRPGKPGLVLDFMEEYRAWIVDRNIIKLRSQLRGQKALTPAIKSGIVKAIDDSFATRIPYNHKKLKLENVMQRQAYRLAGAFVDKKPYKALRMKW